ncbi:hypothetical protein ABW21_db0205960 [Orbilia brochopaga]|nr:hypothetical protein ABW21_db0205960 [Drechslerella brochopaga]
MPTYVDKSTQTDFDSIPVFRPHSSPGTKCESVRDPVSDIDLVDLDSDIETNSDDGHRYSKDLDITISPRALMTLLETAKEDVYSDGDTSVEVLGQKEDKLETESCKSYGLENGVFPKRVASDKNTVQMISQSTQTDDVAPESENGHISSTSAIPTSSESSIVFWLKFVLVLVTVLYVGIIIATRPLQGQIQLQE